MAVIEKKIISDTNLKTELDITIPVDIIENKKESELLKLQKTYKINGFRPGKVPLDVIRKNEGTSLFLRCGEITINETIDDIIKEKNKRISSQPKVTIKKFSEEEGVEVNLILEYMPEIPNIDFSSIKLDKYVINTTEKDVDEAVNRILKNYKNYVEQDNNYLSQTGDRVKINYLGTVDGVPFDGGKADKYDLVLGSNSFIDTFEEQLTNKKAGDKVLVKVKFPDNYHQKALAGKNAEFETEILSVSKAQESELNDEFTKNNFSIDTVDEFKKVLKEETEKNYSNISKNDLRNRLFEYLRDNVNFDLPESMVNEQFEKSWKQKENEISSNKELLDKKEELQEKTREEAKSSIKLGLILSKVAEDNKITIEEREVTKALTERALQMPGYEKFLLDFYKKNKYAMEELRSSVLESKIVDFILSKISMNEIQTSIEDFNKKFEK